MPLPLVKMACCCSLVGQQCQDSAVEVGCSAVRLVQGAVDSAEVFLVGAAAGDGLFPVVSGVGGGRGGYRRRGWRCWFVGGLRFDAVDGAGPVVLPRARWDTECGDSGRGVIDR